MSKLNLKFLFFSILFSFVVIQIPAKSVTLLSGEATLVAHLDKNNNPTNLTYILEGHPLSNRHPVFFQLTYGLGESRDKNMFNILISTKDILSERDLQSLQAMESKDKMGLLDSLKLSAQKEEEKINLFSNQQGDFIFVNKDFISLYSPSSNSYNYIFYFTFPNRVEEFKKYASLEFTASQGESNLGKIVIDDKMLSYLEQSWRDIQKYALNESSLIQWIKEMEQKKAEETNLPISMELIETLLDNYPSNTSPISSHDNSNSTSDDTLKSLQNGGVDQQSQKKENGDEKETPKTSSLYFNDKTGFVRRSFYYDEKIRKIVYRYEILCDKNEEGNRYIVVSVSKGEVNALDFIIRFKLNDVVSAEDFKKLQYGHLSLKRLTDTFRKALNGKITLRINNKSLPLEVLEVSLENKTLDLVVNISLTKDVPSALKRLSKNFQEREIFLKDIESKEEEPLDSSIFLDRAEEIFNGVIASVERDLK